MSSYVCDGEEVEFAIRTVPVEVAMKIDEVSITATKADGSSDFENMKHQGTTFKKKDGDSELKWISSNENHAMWYSSGQGCGDPVTVTYQVKASFEIGGETIENIIGAFSVNADSGEPFMGACLQGGARVKDDWYTGFPAVLFEPVDEGSENWMLSVEGIGTLQRDVKGEATAGNTKIASQFHEVIYAEELIHVDQIEGTKASPIDPAVHFSADYVFQHEFEEYEAVVLVGQNPTSKEVEDLMDSNTAFIADELKNHFDQSLAAIFHQDIRCSIEKTAKSLSGAKFLGTFACAYQQSGDLCHGWVEPNE